MPPGQQLHEQHQAKEGAGGAHSGGREWVHSGQLGRTDMFTRPPRPKNSAGAAGGVSTTMALGAHNRGAGGVEVSASAKTTATSGSEGDNDAPDRPGGDGDGDGDGAGDRGGGKSRSEAEEAWSCCGKSVVSAGRGCEPREPLATVRVLLVPEF